MVRKICILGSTGSIGTQALQVVDQFPEKFKVVGLSARSNIDLLEKQVRKYRPLAVSVLEEGKALELKRRLENLRTTVLFGEEGLKTLATWPEAELILVALVGFSGLEPTLSAIMAGKDIALANKEALVVGGELIMDEARARNVAIIPVDSEHSAIFQCLRGNKKSEIEKIVLTASGGPFFGWSKEKLAAVEPAQALKHPNWSMGAKVTIDSSTLMNKGFEVIEAHWLFDLDYEKIEVVIHPESIIHSMVVFHDGSIMAQMSLPSMLYPIQYALSYPERWKNSFRRLDWEQQRFLTFSLPDMETFPCLSYAYWAGKTGGTMPAVLNAANEICVEGFLQGGLPFSKIPVVLEKILSKHDVKFNPSLEDLKAANAWARQECKNFLLKLKGE